MPIYEYSCRGCGNDFEAIVSANDTPSCPKCESAELDKKFSVFAKPAPSTGAPMDFGPSCTSCCGPDGSGSCGLN